MEKFKKRELRSLAAILVFFVFVFIASNYEKRKIAEERACTAAKDALVQNTFDAKLQDVEAKAFYVYDFTKNAPIVSLDGDTALPLASLTKLMTVRVALKSPKLETLHTVVQEDLVSDAYGGFVVGDTYSVFDLIDAALIASINNAAAMVASSSGQSREVFTTSMNYEAERMGLKTLHFASTTGLDTLDLKPTAVGSAHDVTLLIQKNAVDFPNIFSSSVKSTASIHATNGRGVDLKNTNDAIEKLPLLLASKTGYTVSAGGNLAVLWEDAGGDTFGATVLGSTVTGRFTDMIALHDAAHEYVEGAKKLPKNCHVF